MANTINEDDSNIVNENLALQETAAEIIAPALILVQGTADIIPWNNLKVTLIELLEKSFLAEQNKVTCNENFEILVGNLIKTLDKSATAQEFQNAYELQLSASDDFEADRVIENFVLMLSSVLNNNKMPRDNIAKLFETILNKDNPLFNISSDNNYNNFNYLITKIITDQELIKNRALFYNEDGSKGFFYKLIDNAIMKTGTYYKCARKYLDAAHRIQFEIQDYEELKNLKIIGTERDIDELIKSRENYDDYEILKMREIWTALRKTSREKYIPDESALLTDIKKAAMGLSKREKIFLIKHIRDLQYGILTPIEYEEIPSLYKGEELLTAYFRMVNYLFINYPKEISKERYRNFVLELKCVTWIKAEDNKEELAMADNKVLYAELYGLFSKNLFKDFQPEDRFYLFGYAKDNGYDVDVISIFDNFNDEIRSNEKNDYFYNQKLFGF